MRFRLFCYRTHEGGWSGDRDQRGLWMALLARGHIPRLRAMVRAFHAFPMFIVTEADAAAIRAVFHEEGELSAVIELQRRFPGIADHAKARECARTIAGWKPLPATLCPVTPRRPGGDG